MDTFLVCNLVGWPLNYLFALLIYNIESKNEENIISAFIKKKAEMGDEFRDFTKKNNISKNIVKEFSILLEKSIRLAKHDPGKKKWSLLGAMGFIAETGTTVGYGTLTLTKVKC